MLGDRAFCLLSRRLMFLRGLPSIKNDARLVLRRINVLVMIAQPLEDSTEIGRALTDSMTMDLSEKLEIFILEWY